MVHKVKIPPYTRVKTVVEVMGFHRWGCTKNTTIPIPVGKEGTIEHFRERRYRVYFGDSNYALVRESEIEEIREDKSLNVKLIGLYK